MIENINSITHPSGQWCRVKPRTWNVSAPSCWVLHPWHSCLLTLPGAGGTVGIVHRDALVGLFAQGAVNWVNPVKLRFPKLLSLVSGSSSSTGTLQLSENDLDCALHLLALRKRNICHSYLCNCLNCILILTA